MYVEGDLKMKKYTYNKTLYIFDVFITGIVAMGTLIIATIYLHSQPALYLLAALVCVYTMWNCFISKVHPQYITITKEKLLFNSFNRVDEFKVDEIKKYNLREFSSSGKIYLRINKSNLFSGRYWINTKNYNSSKELFDYLRELDTQLNPDSLKSRAKRVNQEYLKKVEEK